MLEMGSTFLPRQGQCKVIGEVGQAHDGSLGTAHALIDVIADAGAHAVKFQTHIAAAESTPAEPWRVKFSQQDDSRYEYWQRMEFTEPQWRGLREHAHERNLAFLSSPFSDEAVTLLTRVGVDAWKVASGEMANTDMIADMAMSGLPVILSSGMSSWAELDEAVAVCNAENADFSVLQCTTAYPCPPKEWGLNVLGELRQRYRCAVGLSDHSGNIFAGLAAAALGAELLEVHVTLSKSAFGPDVPASLTPSELESLVAGATQIAEALQSPVDKDKNARDREAMRQLFGKSLVASRDLPKGHRITSEDLIAKKPGTGVSPQLKAKLVGRTLIRSVSYDELIQEEDTDD